MNAILRVICAVLAAVTLGAHASPQAIVPVAGISVEAMDPAIQPGDDFYGYANGQWVRTHPVPPDRSWTGAWVDLNERAMAQSRTLVEAAARDPGSRMGALFNSMLDTQARDRQGTQPMKPWLARIAASTDGHTLAATAGYLAPIDVAAFFIASIGEDDDRPGWRVVTLRQGGLGMPDASAYTAGDEASVARRAAYRTFLAAMLKRTGVPPGAAAQRASRVLAFERRLAATHASAARQRDAEARDRTMSMDELAQLAPGFDWSAWLDAMGLGKPPKLVVTLPDTVAEGAAVIATTSVPVLRDYMTLRLMAAYGRYLDTRTEAVRFAFYGTALKGQASDRPLWRRGMDLVTNLLPGDMGRSYAARYLPKASRDAVVAMAASLRSAFAGRLSQADWLSPQARAEALAKLSRTRLRIGYPDVWKADPRADVRPDDLAGNVMRLLAARFARQAKELNQPIDRDAWTGPVNVANAYASASANEVVFPAAALQPPLFDPTADAAANYGRLGATIGHELSHLFDDQGRKYDASGRLHDTWLPEDAARFEDKARRLAQQFADYQPLPGEHVDGRLVQGEAIADLAGLEIALAAFHGSRGWAGDSPASLAADRNFFIAWAQMWQGAYQPDYLRTLLRTDAHPPVAVRAVTVRNMGAWYRAFGVFQEQRLYIAPSQRVEFW